MIGNEYIECYVYCVGRYRFVCTKLILSQCDTNNEKLYIYLSLAFVYGFMSFHIICDHSRMVREKKNQKRKSNGKVTIACNSQTER